MVPVERHARRDQRDSADKIEPALAAEPTEKREATEATEPIERTDPAEPMHRIEPADPIDKIDPLDPMLRSEPAEPADRVLAVFLILGFSRKLRASASSGKSGLSAHPIHRRSARTPGHGQVRRLLPANRRSPCTPPGI